MFLIALITIIVIILLITVGALNPNKGTSPARMRVIVEEARKMDRMRHHAQNHALEKRIYGRSSSAREAYLFVYLMNITGDDEVLNHRLVLAFENQDAGQMCELLGFPSQAGHLHSWLYESKYKA